ncbi:MAG: hypothetical protein ACM31D_12785 [Bacteroidota bacterium]
MPPIRWLLIAILALAPGAAWAAACPANPPAEIRVISSVPQPSYHHDLTRPQIGARAGSGHMTSDRRHLGLTSISHNYTVSPTVAFRRMPDGGICAWLKSVELALKVTQFRVDVAAEYRQGSCAYDEILRHENQHVAIDQRAYVAADRDMRTALADAVRREQSFQVHSTQDQAVKMVLNRLEAAVRPAFELHMGEARRANAAMDTQENYRAEQRRCKDW